jgi:hypothetical protein
MSTVTTALEHVIADIESGGSSALEALDTEVIANGLYRKTIHPDMFRALLSAALEQAPPGNCATLNALRRWVARATACYAAALGRPAERHAAQELCRYLMIWATDSPTEDFQDFAQGALWDLVEAGIGERWDAGKTQHGSSMPYYLALLRHDAVFKRLLERNGIAILRAPSRIDPVWAVIETDNRVMLSAAIEHGLDVNATISDGDQSTPRNSRPITLAIEKSRTSCALELVQDGAELTALDIDGLIDAGMIDVVNALPPQQLLAARCPLQRLVHAQRAVISYTDERLALFAQRLIESGYNPSHGDLEEVVRSGALKTCRVLLDAGMDPGSLHDAAKTPVRELLLAHAANRRARRAAASSCAAFHAYPRPT